MCAETRHGADVSELSSLQLVVDCDDFRRSVLLVESFFFLCRSKSRLSLPLSLIVRLFDFCFTTTDYKVADISLADYGRKDIELAEVEVCFFLIIFDDLSNSDFFIFHF